MIRKTLEISSAPTRLSVKHRQLVIEREDHPARAVPLEDIGILMVDHPAVTYSQAVLTGLAEAGAVVVVCDGSHLPAAVMMPVAGHTTQTERHHAQIEAPAPLRKRLWQGLVSAKLRMQGLVLAKARGSDWGLSAMAERVRSGDPDNLEAQGAQRYFARVFGPDFRRARDGDPPNNLLNYGYMVVRAAVARGLAGSGLLPSLGVHHHHRNNPFCLADDMVEPFRPLVDLKVLGLMEAGSVGPDIGREQKAALLSVFNEVVPLTTGLRTPVSLAIQQATASLAESFMAGAAGLTLPAALPMEPEADALADS